MKPDIIQRPSGSVPIAMSGLVIATIIWHLSRHGLVHQVDEGLAAHAFQVMMPLQVPVIGYFAFRWLPVDAPWAAKVLGIQLALFAAIVASVFFFLDR